VIETVARGETAAGLVLVENEVANETTKAVIIAAGAALGVLPAPLHASTMTNWKLGNRQKSRNVSRRLRRTWPLKRRHEKREYLFRALMTDAQ